MTMILVEKCELAHMYIKDKYVGAVGDTSSDTIIEVVNVFTMDFRIKVNNVRLFIDKIILKNASSEIISSYIVDEGRLIENIGE